MSVATQFGPGRNESCEIVIGFDFGTSCSKVVIRSPDRYNRRAAAVDFEQVGHPLCGHLLPSVLWIGNDGGTSLTRSAKAELARDIKFCVMEGKKVVALGGRDEFDQTSVAVAFLAHALRHAREWFIRTQRELYGSYKLEWTLNVGLPSENFDDEALCRTYDEIAKAAWWLSVTPSAISLNAAKEALQCRDAWDALDDHSYAEVKLIPEVAAEVVGYARSTFREEGLHILVDVGASTLDVCSFILHQKEGDDCYELLTADVRPHGANLLYEHRVTGVRQAVDSHVARLWDSYDPVSPMPDDLAKYVPGHDAISRLIDEQNSQYRTKCLKQMQETLICLKTRRHPHSPRWTSDMPVFLSGGGSMMPFYNDSMDQLSRWLSGFYIGCHGTRALSLSKPENLVAEVDDRAYHRLAVAWGLSYHETEIGSVCRPADIEDVAPRDRYTPTKEFVGKEMV